MSNTEAGTLFRLYGGLNQESRRARAVSRWIPIAAAVACHAVDNTLIDVPPQPVNIVEVASTSSDSLGAIVSHAASTDDSIRVHYRMTDGSESGATPWQSAQQPVTVLGLKPGGEYAMWIEASRERETVNGSQDVYEVPPLPQGISGLRIDVTGAFSSGYSLAPLPGADGHGYLVIFDSVGTIRWYRDFGPNPVSQATQQQNGHFTAYVGKSNGFNQTNGAFVEVTARGDSVRSIAAPAGTYTDPHDLVQTFASDGSSITYLFGYQIRNYERSVAGGPAGLLAIHQLLAIDDAGQADTLFDGAGHWGANESIEPPGIPDLDHPNSLDFDRNGNAIVSYRDLNAIVSIDPNTKQVLWQLGGIRNQFTFVNDPWGGFDGQHDVRVLPNGHLIVFDNGWMHTPRRSRAVEYALDLSRMTATMVWQYAPSPSLFNDFTGSAQRLANGNTLVAFTRCGIVDEVRPDGSLVARATIKLASGAVGTPYRVTRINNPYSFARP